MKCLPREFAEALKKALDLEDVSVERLKKVDVEEGKILTSKLEKLASLDTATRKEELYKIFSQVKSKQTRTKAEIQEIITDFNKGFEERILTSSRDIRARIAKLEEIIANPNSAKNAVSRAKNELADLKGSQEKLLAKQRKALLNWVEKRANDLPRKAKKQTIDKIRDLEFALSEDELPLFLEDMVSAKVGFGITNETKATILKMSQESTAALEAVRAMYDKHLPVLEEFFLKKSKAPELVKLREQLKAGGVKGKTVEEIERALKVEARSYAEDVIQGLRPLEDGIPLTKQQQLKIYSEMTRLGMKSQLLVEMISYQMKQMEWASVSGVRDALRAGKKYEAFQIAGEKAIKLLYEALAFPKSLIASFDISTLMRQGLPVLLSDPKSYSRGLGKTFAESFTDLISSRKAQATKFVLQKTGRLSKDAYYEELGKMFLGSGMKPEEYKEFGKFFDTLNVQKVTARSELAVRPNSLNGKYNIPTDGFGINVLKEESFPSSIPGRIPVAGLPFRASETFFEISALRWRANLADQFIRKMEREGIDWTQKEIADEMSLFVTAMTGRGHPLGLKFLNSNEKLSKFLNVSLFSPRFVGSRIYLYSELAKFVFRANNPATKIAARQLATFVATDAALLVAMGSASYLFWGEEGGLDLTLGSSTFGYVRAGNYTFDFTGGYGSYLTMISKMMQIREGYKYDPRLGEYIPASFAESATGVFSDFLLGKIAPGARILVDILNGYGFGNSELYTTEWLADFIAPIIFVSWREAASADGEADALLVLFAEFIGVSSKNLRIRPMSKEWKEIKEKNPENYQKAVDILNKELPKEIKRLRNDPNFDKLPPEEQRKEINRVVNRIKRETVDPFLKES